METKIAVVTGSYGGLGAELCRLIAKRGVRLVLLDRDPLKSQAFAARLNAEFPAAVLGTFSADLADHSSTQRAAGELVRKYERIHYLFNNAGVLTDSLQFSSHRNELPFEVNALAPLQLIDGLRSSLARAGGSVVVSTTAGLASGVKTLSWGELVHPKAEFKKLFGPYRASKQALNVITAALAREFESDGILVRAADPGPNKTSMTRGTGTPVWMRLFYFALPSATTGANRIVDTAFNERWNGDTGIVTSGTKLLALPEGLAAWAFQDELLRKCRGRVAC